MDKATIERREKELYRTPDPEEVRRQREEDHVQLRKLRRHEQFSKRRAKPDKPVFEDIPANLRRALPQLADRSVKAAGKGLLLLSLLEETADPELAFSAVSFLRKGVSADSSQSQDFGKALVVAGFTRIAERLLTHSHSGVLAESLWILTNLTSGDSTLALAVGTPFVVSKVVELLRHPDPQVVVNCFWTLGNLLGDPDRELSERLRKIQLLPSVLEAANRFLEFHPVDQGTVVWVIGLLIKLQYPARNDLVFDVSVLLLSIAKSNVEAVVQDVLWALNYLTTQESGVRAVIQTSLLPQLLSWLSHSQLPIKLSALRVIGNICASPREDNTDAVLSAGFLDSARSLMVEPAVELRRELLWLFSNILVGPPRHKLLILRDNAVFFIIHSASVQDYKCQLEVTHCLVNFLDGDLACETALKLSSMGVLAALLRLLECSGEELLSRALQVLEVVLTAGAAEAARDSKTRTNKQAVLWDEVGGLSCLEDLQKKASEAVYQQVLRVIDAFYGFEETADVPALPTPERFEFS